ncbi:MIF4G-domain-containing protein [Polychaeton citri CBS 116435]|uniref:Pre-mRNA-splicing factor CWC22 n=1 Tax=Polychaeton citri CBS 116435 TaxID=1314669 RepID=A0A9P4QBY8_9PEZI|nr:MIF4G-domain-containing protein [Polychaeton citri CBS 116435]
MSSEHGDDDQAGIKTNGIQSAVRLPTPEPGDRSPSTASRKRSSPSRSPSPKRDAPSLRRRSYSRSPPPRLGPLPRDVDRTRAHERARQQEMRQREETEPTKPLTDAEKQAAAKAEYDRLLNMRSGGTYIPPARLRALQAQITDKTSKEYQRMAWEALKKSINGLINKVNVSNIKHIVPELFNENLIRGRGLFCRSIMKAQAASLPFTPIYAAMAAIVNTKLPQVGELLINRLIIQFRKAYKRNDKSVCHSSTTFMAHLVNQQVVHEMLAAQILLILLNKPTDDSVEIAVGLTKEVGQHMEEMNSQIALAVYDQFRTILHEGDIDKRTQYMIEVLFQIRKDKYKDNPAVREELDLVEEEDQITHRPSLEDTTIVTEDGLNIFKVDADFEANEEAYKRLKAEILGEVSGSDDDDEDASDESESEDEQETEERALEVKDQSNTDLVNLRRKIYLTLMSSGQFEEATHKLLKIDIPGGREEELPSMIIECCSQERTFNRFYGNIGDRLCKVPRGRIWQELFQDEFVKRYETIHRYETNKLRIVAQFFAFLLAEDAIVWDVFHVVKLNEEETTSSSRIFVKILMEELAQGIGMKALAARLKSDELQAALTGMFPTDNPKNTRFSINFFTAIGMGVLTEGMREWLANMPKPAPAPLPARAASASSRSRSGSVSSYSSYSSYSSRSDSRSRTPPRRRARSPSQDSRSPPPGRRRRYSESVSRSRSPPARRVWRSSEDLQSVPRRRGRSPSYDSRSAPAKRGERASASSSRSPSRSPSDLRAIPHRGAHRDSRSNVSHSRTPPGRSRRQYSVSPSRSPPRRATYGRRRRSASYMSRSRTPSRRRGRSITRSITPLDSKRVGSASSYSSQSRSPPRRKVSPPARKRRRNTSSPETSRSRSPPPKRRDVPPKINGRVVDGGKKDSGTEDLSHIHPSRRGLMS